MPVVCGALGDHDPRRLSQIAEGLGPGLSSVHQDERSVLMLDRPPVSWRGRRAKGLCWSEQPLECPRVATWKDAARGLAACGLVIDEEERYLHSSVAGLSAVFYLHDGDATYFASTIDALARSQPQRRRLSIDWEAWAAIFLLTAPLGDRTPFLEIRRLPPFSTLKHRPGRGPRQRITDWPWAHDRDEGASGPEQVVERLRQVLGEIDASSLICPLSGGWDSRLLLLLAHDDPERRVSAWTLKSSHGSTDETSPARAVVEALGMPLTEIPRARSFWGDQEAIALRTDYQTTHHDWFMPLARRLRRGRHTTLDGLAGGIFLRGAFVTDEMLEHQSWRGRISLLWDLLSGEAAARAMLSQRLASAFASLAWSGWLGEAEPLADHPALPTLVAYRTRTVRAISLAPISVLGREAQVLTPFTDDGVVRAALAIPPREKLGGELYRRVLAHVDPKVGLLPSTNDPDFPPSPASAEKRPFSARVLEGYRERLRANPLQSEISRAVWEPTGSNGIEHALAGSRSGHLVRALALLSMWQQRYAGVLRKVDCSELFE